MIGRGHIGKLPPAPARRLHHDAIHDNRIAKPDIRDPFVKLRRALEIKTDVRGIGAVLDDARLVDYVDIHPFSEVFLDPGEIHPTRVISCTFVFGKDRAEPLHHPGVKRSIEEFQPRVHEAQRPDNVRLCLFPEEVIPGDQGLLDLPVVQERDRPYHGKRDQDHDEGEVGSKVTAPPPAGARRRHGAPPSLAFRRVNRTTVPPPSRLSAHILPP